LDPSHLLNLLVTGVLRGGMYALTAVGLSLVFGVMNIPNFAHGEFYMLGAYLAYFGYAVFHLGPVLSLVFAAAGVFLFGILVDKGLFETLRKRSKGQWLMNTFLLTLGISVVLQNGVRMIWGSNFLGITSYWKGKLQIGTMDVAMDRVTAFGIALAAIFIFWLFLNRTRTGRAIRAVSMDETGAQLVGIDLGFIHTLTFALSVGLAALAGASLLSITPANPAMGIQPCYKSWFVLILVGMGNVEASIWGGFIIGLLETISYMTLGAGWQDAVTLAIIILILLFKPSGIFARKGVRTAWE
jgi:branched-chain amino acid transport system permease protein